MKNNKFYSIGIIISLFALITIFNGCKKEDKEEETPTGSVPTLTTVTVSSVNYTSATCGGNITSDGGATVTSRGVCWSTGQTPTISDNKTSDGTGAGAFVSNLTDLNSNTTYYVRAYATNSNGTGYGSAMSFTTQVVTDIDGNTYDVVEIGTQIWMKENLKVTKLNDGTSIPIVTDNSSWSSMTTPAYCWYDNNALAYKDVYGAMYNYYTVNTDKLCPIGWHVPGDLDLNYLITYLGGENVAGTKLKEAGSTHWSSSNTATNESGFTALPGGIRVTYNNFQVNGTEGYWWSNFDISTDSAMCFYLISSFESILSNYYLKSNGMSVRCLKD